MEKIHVNGYTSTESITEVSECLLQFCKVAIFSLVDLTLPYLQDCEALVIVHDRFGEWLLKTMQPVVGFSKTKCINSFMFLLETTIRYHSSTI